jgi:phenazine biosynthesis protein
MTTMPETHTSLADDAQVRRDNRAVVEEYMRARGEQRLTRHLLFTEDGCGGLWTTETGEPIVIRGRDRLGDHAVWSLQCFPDWKWYDVEIFETQDPDVFWVECEGEGKIVFPGYPVGFYRNHFLHSFRFENGRIKQQREFMNPCNQFRALQIPVPEVIRRGIPT